MSLAPAPFAPSPFSPPRWLRNGHANTLYSFLRPRRVRLPAAEPAWVPAAPGVELLLQCHWQPEPGPAVLLVHGLEGSSEAGYMQTAAALALARGWHAIRMNVRNCGQSEGRSATLYNSGMSGDVALALDWLLAQPRARAAAVAGFSMGGNLVLKFAGEAGGDFPARLRAVAAVSPCLDLAPCADALHRRANFLYERRFLRFLRARMRRHGARFPGVFPVERLAGLRSVREFDEVFTAPFTGYRDAADYYARASAANVLDAIRVPTLVLCADDDPFIVITPASRARLRANPAITFLPTPHGGHCAFMNGRSARGVYWAEATIMDFCAQAFADPTTSIA